MKHSLTFENILSLLVIYLIYSCVGILTKYASMQEFLSLQYCAFFIGSICIMAIYAVLWQQIIKRIDVSTAYMFKGTTIVFIMLFAYLLFQEPITWNNIIGSIIIISGITLYAKG